MMMMMILSRLSRLRLDYGDRRTRLSADDVSTLLSHIATGLLPDMADLLLGPMPEVAADLLAGAVAR